MGLMLKQQPIITWQRRFLLTLPLKAAVKHLPPAGSRTGAENWIKEARALAWMDTGRRDGEWVMAWTGFTGACCSGNGHFTWSRFVPCHRWPPATPVIPVVIETSKHKHNSFLLLSSLFFFFWGLKTASGSTRGHIDKISIGLPLVSQRPASCNISIRTCTPAHASGKGE